jgi:hypothetical protein
MSLPSLQPPDDLVVDANNLGGKVPVSGLGTAITLDDGCAIGERVGIVHHARSRIATSAATLARKIVVSVRFIIHMAGLG